MGTHSETQVLGSAWHAIHSGQSSRLVPRLHAPSGQVWRFDPAMHGEHIVAAPVVSRQYCASHSHLNTSSTPVRPSVEECAMHGLQTPNDPDVSVQWLTGHFIAHARATGS